MSKKIENFISKNEINSAIKECLNTYNIELLKILLYKYPITTEEYYDAFLKLKKISEIKIKLLCNWCSSEELCKLWNKMSKGNFRWNNIKLIWKEEDNPDYYIVINWTTEYHKKNKTIYFRMEPLDTVKHIWDKEWVYINPFEYLKIFTHEISYNNLEWHLSKTYNELMLNKDIEKTKIFSTVLSGKYNDKGHKMRIDFVKYIETKIDIDVFGDNKFNYKKYNGKLPLHCKDDAILPYKYTFNCENNQINNYVTEKLIDGILGECLVFYSGCPNISELIDNKAYVYLELKDFEKDYNIIKNAIEKDLYSERLLYIKKEKHKILNELQFFPRIEKFLTEIQFKNLNIL